jgi:hypothetical protein
MNRRQVFDGCIARGRLTGQRFDRYVDRKSVTGLLYGARVEGCLTRAFSGGGVVGRFVEPVTSTAKDE